MNTINELKNYVGKYVKAIFMILEIPYLKYGKLNEITANDVDINGRIISFKHLRRIETVPGGELIYFNSNPNQIVSSSNDTIYCDSRTGRFSSSPPNKRINKEKKRRK